MQLTIAEVVSVDVVDGVVDSCSFITERLARFNALAGVVKVSYIVLRLSSFFFRYSYLFLGFLLARGIASTMTKAL
jgi:hypothetical protein